MSTITFNSLGGVLQSTGQNYFLKTKIKPAGEHKLMNYFFQCELWVEVDGLCLVRDMYVSGFSQEKGFTFKDAVIKVDQEMKERQNVSLIKSPISQVA